MLINKDAAADHAVQVAFAGDEGRRRNFSGPVDRVVFGAAEYVWRPDPGAAPPSSGGGRGMPAGHPDPDGPPSKSTIPAAGADTSFSLPKASIVVLRGRLSK